MSLDKVAAVTKQWRRKGGHEARSGKVKPFGLNVLHVDPVFTRDKDLVDLTLGKHKRAGVGGNEQSTLVPEGFQNRHVRSPSIVVSIVVAKRDLLELGWGCAVLGLRQVLATGGIARRGNGVGPEAGPALPADGERRSGRAQEPRDPTDPGRAWQLAAGLHHDAPGPQPGRRTSVPSGTPQEMAAPRRAAPEPYVANHSRGWLCKNQCPLGRFGAKSRS